jgi:predicted branched-subunit amino acid permease
MAAGSPTDGAAGQRMNGPSAGERAIFTLGGLRQGALTALMMTPSVFVFATVVGAASAQKGLTLGEAMLMSLIVFAGASQMVALEVWPQRFDVAGILAVVGVTAIVNSRLILMSASLRLWLAGQPAGLTYAHLALLTDPNYVVYARHRHEGGRDAGVLVGSGVTLWLVWVIGTLPGHWLAGGIADPRRWALDLVMPIVFSVMATPLWRGHRETRAWLAAAAAALACHALVPGHWYIVAGALAGMLFAAFDPFVADEAEPAR